MKITKRVLSLLVVQGVAAASLLAGCSGDDSGSTTNNIYGTAGAGSAADCDEPGGSYCNSSGSGVVCAEGSTSGVPFTCASGEVCADGACVGQCEAGATECVGADAYRICSADGKQWVPVACQPGQKCEDGACVDTCEEGETACKDGGTQQVCDGGKWKDVECPADTACSDGACAGNCTVGQTKCDPSADFLTALFGGDGLNLGVVWTCTDGTKWEIEPCADGEYCTYSGVDAGEVERYRQGIKLFFMSEGQTEMPAAPTVPANSKASCTANPCPTSFFETFEENPFDFFESPAGVRLCGDPAKVEDENYDWYGSVAECSGLPPYAPLKLNVTECPGDLQCAPLSAQTGCAKHECAVGETTCQGSNMYYCDSVNLSLYNNGSCTYGCTETGDFGERTAVCNDPPK